MDEIESWDEEFPDANCGIVLGKISNLIVVDSDNEMAAKVISSLFPNEFKCPSVKTPRGGRHFYFRYDPNINQKIIGLFPKCDVLSDRTYAIAPPSISTDGGKYEWEKSPFEEEIPHMPEDVRAFIVALRDVKYDRWKSASQILFEGTRDDDLYHIALALARHGVGKERTTSIILRLAAICDSLFTEREALQKVESAYKITEEKGKDRGELIINELSTIDSREVEWLWPNYIPKGTLTLLVGDPDVGKSLLSIDIAARFTSGKPWPGSEEPHPAGSVIIFTAEDGIANTVRPRVEAAGADVVKIKYVDGVSISRDDVAPFTFDEHMAHLERSIKENSDVKLIIVDPITAYLGRLKDDNSILRSKVFSPLAKMAERYGVSILAITHFKKDAKAKALYRSHGSIGYMAASRAAYGVFKARNDPNRRIFCKIKNNLVKEVPPLAFAIQGPQGSPSIVFESDLLNEEDVESLLNGENESPKAGEAKKFLLARLKNGKVESSLLESDALKLGISKSTLNRAKEALKIKPFKGTKDDGNKWYWELHPSV